ncbi:ribonuclease P protein component [Candidatus Karelsulcia muelleri]
MKGQKLAKNSLNVSYRETEYNEKESHKVALFVSKKQLRKSFKRNRIKRCLIRSYQLNKKRIPLNKQKRYYLLFRYRKQKIKNFYEIKKCFEHVISKMFGDSDDF